MNPISDQDIDTLAKGYRSDFQPDVEAGLARLKGRMQPQARVRPIQRRRWLGIAASLLVLATVSALTYHQFFGGISIVNEGEVPMRLELADGTDVWLQQNTEIRYDRTFNDVDRKVELNGQAYFEVQSDKTRPFLVQSGNAELRVTGTTFNLRVEGGEMEVEVSEGSVMLTGKNNGVAVTQQECGMVMPDGAVMHMKSPALNRHAWRTGTFTFDNTPLREVLKSIENNFRVEVVLEGNEDFPVKGTFRAENAEDALTAIAKLGGGKLALPTNESPVYRLYNM